MTLLPEAVLWDMDGTLIDSEPYWMSAEDKLTQAYGIEWTHEDALGMVGNALSVSAEMLRAKGVPLSDEEIIDYLTGQVGAQLAERIPWQQGALEALQMFQGMGVPQALVTMAYRNVAQNMLDALPDGLLHASVCGDEVSVGKPDPAPFLQAAGMLDVDITRCLVVEDSPSGIAAAVASGARVIGVQAIIPVAAHPKISRFDTLERLTSARAKAIMAGETFDFLG